MGKGNFFPFFQPKLRKKKIKGSPQQNIDYCSKSGQFHERGRRPTGAQGTRTDLQEAIEDIKGGKRLAELIEQHPREFAKYPRGMLLIHQHFASVSADSYRAQLSVTYVFGPSGAGKTERVWQQFGREPGRLFSKPSGAWFDGYEGQEAALFDDFRGDLPFHEFLRTIDKFPYKVPVKGGFIPWSPKEIFLTSTREPLQIYKNCFEKGEDPFQLLRRIHTIEIFGFGGQKRKIGEFDFEFRSIRLTDDIRRQLTNGELHFPVIGVDHLGHFVDRPKNILDIPSE